MNSTGKHPRLRRGRLLTRPVLADRGLVTLVLVLCTMVVLGATSATTWLRVTADDMVEEVLDSAQRTARQLQVTYTEVTSPVVPPHAGGRLHRSLSPQLQQMLAVPRHAAVLAEGIPQAVPRRDANDPLFMSVVGLPGLREQITIVAGRFPRPGAHDRRLPKKVAGGYDGPPNASVVEVALHRVAAEQMNLPIGTYVLVNPLRYAPPADERPSLLRISGTYETTAPFPAPLDDVPNVRRPAISEIPEANSIRAAAVAANARTVLEAPWVGIPEVRFTFDQAGTPTAEDMESVAAEARRLVARPWPPVVHGMASTATTGIGELASSFLEQRRASDSLAILVLAALAAAAAAGLVLAASVLEARRREVTAVLRARGASTGRLLALRGSEAMLLLLPGLAGAGLLVLLGPAHRSEMVPAFLAAGGCVVLLSLVQVAPWQGLSDRVRLASRDAVQAAFVFLAAAGLALVPRRGSVDPGDPLLLVLPGLVGVAAAVLVVRGVQRLAGWLRGLSAGRTGLGAVVGTSQVGAAAARAVLPVVAVVLAGSAAMLSLGVGDTLLRAAERTGWEQVGADAVVRDGTFDDDLVRRIEQLPGVAAVAGVRSTSTGRVRTRVGPRAVTVVAVDREAWSRVRADAPEALRMTVPASDQKLTALVSSDLDLEDRGTTLGYADSTVALEVAGRVDELVGPEVDGSFIVVDLDAFRTAVDRDLRTYDTLLLAGSPEPEAVGRLVEPAAPLAEVETRAAVTEAAREEGVVARTLTVAQAATISVAVLAGLGAMLAVVLGHPLRRRTQLLLRDLGADLRQARRTTSLELAPVIGVAGAAALGCGALLTAMVGYGVDLGALTGVGAGLAMVVDMTSWLVASAAVVLLVLAVTVASARDGLRRGARADEQ